MIGRSCKWGIKWCMNVVTHYAWWNKLLNLQLRAFPPILALKQIVGLMYTKMSQLLRVCLTMFFCIFGHGTTCTCPSCHILNRCWPFQWYLKSPIDYICFITSMSL
jgi:hypothetical protein